jgi:hypothetical protein
MGQLVVAHSATRAVRSAVVILDDDPEYYDGAARGDLLGGNPESEYKLLKFAGELNNEYAKLVDAGERKGGARLEAIRGVAHFPLSILAPSLEVMAGAKGLNSVVGGSPLGRFTISAAAYNQVAASVTLHAESEGPAVDAVAPHTPVTVKVAYMMRCSVPLVNRIMCSSGSELLRASLGLPAPERATQIVAGLEGVQSPLLRDTLFAMGGSYTLLTAEATLPNHGARYHKRAE